ncbi:MAG: NAD-dependent epimerase/dehydratase family protein [Deltaproteobacteria bacterium]|jgi:nucleoside-diphosphate-sugar epimerase|nr:NAD-dependent epimerase/dehydratase family protein [Deltaproteobacteria bacterium]
MRVFLTGGGGFLGGWIARMLLDQGCQVKLLVRNPGKSKLPSGAEVVKGDLSGAERLRQAVCGCEAVIHCAARVGLWGPLSSYIEDNAMATARLLNAAKLEGVRYFVYTSSPSVVHGGENLFGIDETAPYSLDISQSYAYSKMLAERLVLMENCRNFKTLAIRPHLIWGPGDPHLVPQLVERADRGRLFLFSGGPYLVDATYIENAAKAHAVALEKLAGGAAVDGEAFFIAQGQPMDINVLIARILEAAGAKAATRRIPKGLGLLGASLLEKIWKTLSLASEPPVTVFTVKQLSTSHWFNLEKAKRLLDYRPWVSFEDGLERLKDYYKNTKADKR